MRHYNSPTYLVERDGFEPPTLRLSTARSTTELPFRNFGAWGWDRTTDAQFFKLPLYALSYPGRSAFARPS